MDREAAAAAIIERPELMEEASGAAEDATAERICCPNDNLDRGLPHHLWILRASHCPTFGGSIVARFHPSDKGFK